VTITPAPTTTSKSVTTPIDDAIVGTDEPRILARTSAIFRRSPPRAGVKEFSATPAAYAPAIPSRGTGRSG
jgi:hypothetical protein